MQQVRFLVLRLLIVRDDVLVSRPGKLSVVTKLVCELIACDDLRTRRPISE